MIASGLNLRQNFVCNAISSNLGLLKYTHALGIPLPSSMPKSWYRCDFVPKSVGLYCEVGRVA